MVFNNTLVKIYTFQHVHYKHSQGGQWFDFCQGQKTNKLVLSQSSTMEYLKLGMSSTTDLKKKVDIKGTLSYLSGISCFSGTPGNLIKY